MDNAKQSPEKFASSHHEIPSRENLINGMKGCLAVDAECFSLLWLALGYPSESDVHE